MKNRTGKDLSYRTNPPVEVAKPEKNSQGTHVFEIPKAYRPAKLQEIGIPWDFCMVIFVSCPPQNRVSESSSQWWKSGGFKIGVILSTY